MARKIAFVTGASNVTGKAIAIELARAGYDVGFTYTSNEDGAKRTQKELEALGAKCKYYYMNTRELEPSIATLNEFCSEFGPLDTMVNNVSITTEWSFLDVTPDGFDRLSEINIRGTYFMMQAAAKIMIAGQKHGAIINIASVHAIGTLAKSSVYATTKAAICRMTRSVALELAPYGINVNAFAPGYVNMETSDIYKDPEKLAEYHKITETMAHYMPKHRWQKPQEIGQCVVFLASEAARFIVGQTIFAEGGVTIPIGSQPDWPQIYGFKDIDFDAE